MSGNYAMPPRDLKQKFRRSSRIARIPPPCYRHIMKNMFTGMILVSVLLLVSGCASKPTWARYELCFGLSADSGHTRISNEQWLAFRDAEIAPRFPDGFTVCSGDGFWRNGSKTYGEASKILIVIALDTEDTGKKLDAIATAFARRFIQESVLEVKSPVSVDFHRYP